jgi:tRNA-dihydrouridine synthase 2
MIGTTRKINPFTSTVDFTRLPSNGSKDPRKDQPESIIYRLHPEREGSRLIFQLGTSDPKRAVAAARLVAADVAGIDVNAGCPKPFSTSGGMGAALLRMPDKLCSILEALVKNITPEFEIGISVKIRLLETPDMTEDLVRRLCATGITGLTVHCRTTPMRPRERAIREQLKMIAGICREAGVACLMNGDVENRDQAKKLVAEYGVDGAMIATAAEANSSCFRSKADGGLAPWREVVGLYAKLAMEVENRWGNTKYLLGHLVPGKDPVYRGITATKSYSNACEVLELPHLIDLAKQVDEKLNLGLDGKNSGKSNQKNHGGKAHQKSQPTLPIGGGVKRKRSVEIDETTPREMEAPHAAIALSV